MTIFIFIFYFFKRERELLSILQWNNVDKIYVKYTQVHHTSAEIPSVGLREFIF